MRVMLDLMGVMETPKRNLHKRFFSPPEERDPFHWIPCDDHFTFDATCIL